VKYFWYTLTWIVIVGLLIGIGIWCYLPGYNYRQQVSGYLMLADDASTAKLKLEYIEQYKDAVHKHVYGKNARYIWKTPQTNINYQKNVLDSLVDRVKQTSLLDEKSFEYQTAMNQITGQEFEGAMSSTNSLFYDAYKRQRGWSYYLRANGAWWWIWCLVLCVAGGLLNYLVYWLDERACERRRKANRGW
jgi:hypothetical protein